MEEGPAGGEERRPTRYVPPAAPEVHRLGEVHHESGERDAHSVTHSVTHTVTHGRTLEQMQCALMMTNLMPRVIAGYFCNIYRNNAQIMHIIIYNMHE